MLETHTSKRPASLNYPTGGANLSEPGSGRGRSHGTSAHVPFDRWFRYPAGFASDYVSLLLQDMELSTGDLVVDPFTGSGVTGTSCRGTDVLFYGIEAHPLIAELADLKLRKPPADLGDLEKRASSFAYLADRSRQALGKGATKIIERETELVQRSFDTQVLLALILLREMIKNDADEWELYLKWALLATLRDVASVKVGWPYQRPSEQRKPKFSDPFARFTQRVSWIAADLREHHDSPWIKSRVVCGDSRDEASWDAGTKAQGSVSSPPYLNNFDYADATRLEVYFWGYASSWSELCGTVRKDMLTATTQQSSVGSASAAIKYLTQFGDIAGTVADLTEKLTKERTKRKRGKEYDRVLPDYFSAIAKILGNLASSLETGAPSVWLIGDSAPYGVYVDTPLMVGQLAEQLGFSVEKDVTLRRRGQRWAGNSGRHNIELTERSLLFRRR